MWLAACKQPTETTPKKVQYIGGVLQGEKCNVVPLHVHASRWACANVGTFISMHLDAYWCGDGQIHGDMGKDSGFLRLDTIWYHVNGSGHCWSMDPLDYCPFTGFPGKLVWFARKTWWCWTYRGSFPRGSSRSVGSPSVCRTTPGALWSESWWRNRDTNSPTSPQRERHQQTGI